MADLENGYVRIANELVEAIAVRPIPGRTRRVLDVIIRYTYGYNRKESMIPSNVFTDMTGLTFQDMCRARKRLEMSNMIIVGGTQRSRTYAINSDISTWRELPTQLDLAHKPNSPSLAPKPNSDDSVWLTSQHSLAHKPNSFGSEAKDLLYKEKNKENLNKCASAMHFESIWAQYPKRIGKKEAWRHYKSSVKTEKDRKRIEIAISSFLDSKYGGDKDVTYVPLGKTWFYNWEEWCDGEPVSSSNSEHIEEY